MPKSPIAILLCAIALHVPVSFAETKASDLPAADRLHSCDPRVALEAANEFLNDPNNLKEPLQLFFPAAILFQNGKKDEAVFWFYAAELRVRYQLAFEKGDRSKMLSIMQMTVGPPINNYAFQDVVRLDRIIDKVILWDKTAPNPLRSKAQPKDIEAKLEKIYAGLRDLKAKLPLEKADLERKAKLEAPQMELQSVQSRVRPCRPGEPDPAAANRTIELEKKSVTEFAMNHKEVLREAGAIKFANVTVYKLNRDSGLPSRYSVAIDGTVKRAFAEIDVSRSGNDASFALACVSQLLPGQRPALKDVCKK